MMRKIKLPILLSLLALSTVLNHSCSEEETSKLIHLEQDYVLFLDALYFDQTELSLLAYQDLSLAIDRVGEQERPLNEDICFHLDQATSAFTDAGQAIKEEQLELARTLVDRATYELYTADNEMFNSFYIGSFYNFFASWQDVNYIINDPKLCLLDWPELRDRVNDMNTAWRLVESRLPNPVLYPWSEQRLHRFIDLRTELSLAIDYFTRSLDSGDQTSVIIASTAIRMTLWPLLRQFGPEPAI